ncbi:hypothetical protein AMTRI_Chr11g150220 [Amborella trichopoda]
MDNNEAQYGGVFTPLKPIPTKGRLAFGDQVQREGIGARWLKDSSIEAGPFNFKYCQQNAASLQSLGTISSISIQEQMRDQPAQNSEGFYSNVYENVASTIGSGIQFRGGIPLFFPEASRRFSNLLETSRSRGSCMLPHPAMSSSQTYDNQMGLVVANLRRVSNASNSPHLPPSGFPVPYNHLYDHKLPCKPVANMSSTQDNASPLAPVTPDKSNMEERIRNNQSPFPTDFHLERNLQPRVHPITPLENTPLQHSVLLETSPQNTPEPWDLSGILLQKTSQPMLFPENSPGNIPQPRICLESTTQPRIWPESTPQPRGSLENETGDICLNQVGFNLEDSSQEKEHQNVEKSEAHGIDLNKTPAQKPRRKKIRPKVIREDKPKRSPKTATQKEKVHRTPNTASPKENGSVRKRTPGRTPKALMTRPEAITSPATMAPNFGATAGMAASVGVTANLATKFSGASSSTAKVGDATGFATKIGTISCRRVLNFDAEIYHKDGALEKVAMPQEKLQSGGERSEPIIQIQDGHSSVEKPRVEKPFDLNHTLPQMPDSYQPLPNPAVSSSLNLPNPELQSSLKRKMNAKDHARKRKQVKTPQRLHGKAQETNHCPEKQQFPAQGAMPQMQRQPTTPDMFNQNLQFRESYMGMVQQYSLFNESSKRYRVFLPRLQVNKIQRNLEPTHIENSSVSTAKEGETLQSSAIRESNANKNLRNSTIFALQSTNREHPGESWVSDKSSGDPSSSSATTRHGAPDNGVTRENLPKEALSNNVNGESMAIFDLNAHNDMMAPATHVEEKAKDESKRDSDLVNGLDPYQLAKKYNFKLISEPASSTVEQAPAPVTKRKRRAKKEPHLIGTMSSPNQGASECYKINACEDQSSSMKSNLYSPMPQKDGILSAAPFQNPQPGGWHILPNKYITDSQSSSNLQKGPKAKEAILDPMGIIVQKMNALAIVDKSIETPNDREHNQLVPYIGAGVVIPYEAPKRRLRAKVDLDEETTRVWKLLLENDTDGLDGAEKDKEKWWQEERRVFCGRADSFIARMHLVQGDRRFSKWKGSVVDSVIGVFLTQNVSDHLSSSAFMALAAKFPLKKENKNTMAHPDLMKMSSQEPEIVILEVDETIQWQRDLSGTQIPSESPMVPPDNECRPELTKEITQCNESYGSNIMDEKESTLQGTHLPEQKIRQLSYGEVLEHQIQIPTTAKAKMSLAEAESSELMPNIVPDLNSSQYSTSTAQTFEAYGSSSGSTPDIEDLVTCSNQNYLYGSQSFMDLLNLAETNYFRDMYISGNFTVSSKEYIASASDHFESMLYGKKISSSHQSGYQKVSSSLSNDSSLVIQTQVELEKTLDEEPSNGYNFIGTECAEVSVGANKSPLLSADSETAAESCTNCTGRQADSNKETAPELINLQNATYGTQPFLTSAMFAQISDDQMHSSPSSVTRNPRRDSNFSNILEKEKWQSTTQGSNGTSQIIIDLLDDHEHSFPEKSAKQNLLSESPPMAKDANHAATLMNLQPEGKKILEQCSSSSLTCPPDVAECSRKLDGKIPLENIADGPSSKDESSSVTNAMSGKMEAKEKKVRTPTVRKKVFDWEAMKKHIKPCTKERSPETQDSVDWEAVRCAEVNEIADTIRERGMNHMLAERIKDFLNRLVTEHGSIDLEWLRDVPPDKAKEYLLSVRGLGLKSVECVRLLTLQNLAFPVDTNVGRICVRLGWVPLQPLPESLQLHLLEMYPVLESIQKYIWPRLCKLDQRTLYELHYQMITFGKVFCTKSKPNCNACPMRGECKHFASAFASARLALPGPREKGLVGRMNPYMTMNEQNSHIHPLPLPPLETMPLSQEGQDSKKCEPIIEEPATPEPECIESSEIDIEDSLWEDPEEIPTIDLNLKGLSQNVQTYMEENHMGLQDPDMSKALVALTPEAASIPMPKLKNVGRLRTEHQVYELPDNHPLLQDLDQRELDDPCTYLLAIWTPGETADSIESPEMCCNSQASGKLCEKETCFACNSIREANSQTVRGTLLIPSRTAMRGSFPLNGTYFQVNEVFADHESSLNPIAVPRSWIWNLPRRTVYFGTSIPTIFRGLTLQEIQYCFWRGFVCVRGFDQQSRAPRPLLSRLHYPASRLTQNKNGPKKEVSANSSTNPVKS